MQPSYLNVQAFVVAEDPYILLGMLDVGAPTLFPEQISPFCHAGVSGAPSDNNIMLWNAVIFGPHDTPFEDGTFKLTIEFTEEYPNKPPTVRFVSKMFHPNVYADGGICLDILQNRSSPTLAPS